MRLFRYSNSRKSQLSIRSFLQLNISAIYQIENVMKIYIIEYTKKTDKYALQKFAFVTVNQWKSETDYEIKTQISSECFQNLELPIYQCTAWESAPVENILLQPHHVGSN